MQNLFEKKFIVFLIILILFYDTYITRIYKPSTISNSVMKTEKVDATVDTTDQNYYINDATDLINTLDNEKPIDLVVSPNMFGKPSEQTDKYILWENSSIEPWTRIVYKPDDHYPFYFFVKIRIPSLNDYQNWKNIINNIDFNPRPGEMIIPTMDEETALGIVYLILLNFKGDISTKDIVNNNILDTVINKIKKSNKFKNKIRQDIIDQLNPKFKESFNDTKIKHTTDDFDDIKGYNDLQQDINDNEYGVYEGAEFSFI